MMALCDGTRLALLASSEDHKAVGDGDVGPNTGGMGTVSPSPLVDDALAQRILETLFVPTVRALTEAGRPFRGLLYGGLMLTPDRGPMVIEWNCRFGDPETQSVLMRLDGDLLPWLAGAAAGAMPRGRAARAAGRGGVRGAGRRQLPRQAARRATRSPGCRRASDDLVVFHAGTRRDAERAPGDGGRARAGRDGPRRRPDGGARPRLRRDRRHPFRWYAFPARHRHCEGRHEHERSETRCGHHDGVEVRPRDHAARRQGAREPGPGGRGARAVGAPHARGDRGVRQGRGPPRREGVHLRRGRRRPPRGRGRRAHHAPGHRRPDRRPAASVASTRCCRPCRCRRACRSPRWRLAAPRTPACWPRRSSPSPIPSWASASRRSGPRAARRCSTATPRSGARSPGADRGRLTARARNLAT